MRKGNLKQYYAALAERFGPQHWWPADTPFEVMVGAILTQNTNWTNVEKAMANLMISDLLDPHRGDCRKASARAGKIC